MFERKISTDDVLTVVLEGQVIAEYPDDTPYPSVLLHGFQRHRSIHVVAGLDHKAMRCIVITAYEPSPDEWFPGYRMRKTK